MDVFASGTDEKDILERAEHSGWNVALILNKKGKIFGHIADLDLGIYCKEVPVYIDYDFDEDEFDDRLLELVHKAEDLTTARTILNLTMSDYHGMIYPLTTEETDFLDSVIKDRFKRKTNYAGTSKKNETNKVVPIVQGDPLKRIGNGEMVQMFNDMPDNPEDYFTENEWEIILGAKNKSYQEMTEREFNLVYEYENFFRQW